MKVTGLVVVKSQGEDSEAMIMAKAIDMSQFGFFQKPWVEQFIVFAARMVAKRTPIGQRQSVQQQDYQVDIAQPWPYLDEALIRFQDPAESDRFMMIQRDLDETKTVLHRTIKNLLERGERLDSLVERSSDLSTSAQIFYRQARRTNRCCSSL